MPHGAAQKKKEKKETPHRKEYLFLLLRMDPKLPTDRSLVSQSRPLPDPCSHPPQELGTHLSPTSPSSYGMGTTACHNPALILPGAIGQRSPAFLAPGTGSMEDNFSTNDGERQMKLRSLACSSPPAVQPSS